ncbi:guanine nucleotide transporter, partial [Reticulomyxa filosa]
IFVGSMAGGIASIIVSSPLDVIKTRLQNKSFDDKRSGFRVLSELVKEEGFHAFFKGLTPKIGLIGPKLVFSFTVAQWLTKEIQIHLEKK